MGFVNEKISSENIEKYDIAAIDRSFFKAHYHPQWTVDIARNIYLRRMSTDREFYYDNFSYFWNGTLLHICLQRHFEGDEKANSESPSSTTWTVFSIGGHAELMFPDELNEHRTEVIFDLKEALTVFNVNGLTSNPLNHTVRFEF